MSETAVSSGLQRVAVPAWDGVGPAERDRQADASRAARALARFDDRFAPLPRMVRLWFARKAGRRRPFMVNIAVSRACNLGCEACAYYDESQTEHVRARRDPTTAELQAMIDNVSRLGTAVLSFLGGEPTVRRDIVDLGVYARQRGLYSLLVTNGTRMNDALVERIPEGFHRVGVSLDGDRESNDAIRGAGSYDLAVAGVRRFVASRARRGFATRIHLGLTLQRGHAEGALRLAEEGLWLGVDQFFLHVNYLPRVRPTRDELGWLIDRLRALSAGHRGYLAGNQHYFERLLAYAGEGRFECDAHRLGHVRVSVLGEVNPCPVGVPFDSIADARDPELAARFDGARVAPRPDCGHGCVRNDQLIQDKVFDPLLPNPFDVAFALGLR